MVNFFEELPLELRIADLNGNLARNFAIRFDDDDFRWQNQIRNYREIFTTVVFSEGVSISSSSVV